MLTPRRSKRKIIKHGSEAEEQAAVVRYLNVQYPHVLYCASAGGVRTSYMQAARMKMTGYKAGFPDLQILEPRQGYHGLFIEMKRAEGGQVSREQKEWIAALNERGYMAVVCKGFESAKKTIDEYLS